MGEDGGSWNLEWSFEAMGLYAITALLGLSLLLSCLIPIALRKPSKLPPGPRALPILGHMHLLGTHLPQSLAQLSHRYGPLISVKLGSIPFIVASTPDAARQILQTCDSSFAFRTSLASVKAIYGTSTGITFSDPSPYWRFLRQLCATDLFSSRRLEAFKPIRDEEVSALIQSIYAAEKDNLDALVDPSCTDEGVMAASPPPVGVTKTVHLRSKLHAAANNIISRMAIGQTSETALPPVMEALSAVNLGDFFPWIQWADLQGCVRNSKKAGQRMHAAFQGIIEQRREQRGGVYDPPADILDILLSAASTCTKDLQITDAHIRAVLLDIFGGGTDTSGIVLEWAMAELLANPTEMRKVEEEIEDVVCKKDGKEKKMEEADIQNMPYLRAVVKETMRLHPVVPLLVPRESRSACKIFGFDIPAQTRAFVNVWAIGRDPNVWERPLDFHPERFLHNGIDVRGQHFEFLPFGSGRRVCPGQNLGILNVHTILACLIHAFSWSPYDQENDMSEKFGFLTSKAKPLVARATPKQPSHFYTRA